MFNVLQVDFRRAAPRAAVRTAPGLREVRPGLVALGADVGAAVRIPLRGPLSVVDDNQK